MACLGTNHSKAPLRSQMEQLQDMSAGISPSTSNAIWPQWQLPWYFTWLYSFLLVLFSLV
jgi:hypothetical protein